MSGFAAVVINQKLYIVGGNDGKIRQKVYCLDLETKEWKTLPDLL